MNKWGKIGCTAALALLLIVLVVLLKTFDVAAIGPMDTSVGFSHLNGAFASLVGYNELWYRVTKLLGYGAFAVCGAFGALGAWQLITRKSLQKVDRKLLYLAGLYVVTILLYVLFEKVVINARPVLLPGETEPAASFPSTHTMLAIVVFGSAILLLPDYIASRPMCLAARIAAWALLLVTVIGRAVSGVHWLTDILGGVMLGTLLLSVFELLAEAVPSKR